jgi:hypothetical protein
MTTFLLPQAMFVFVFSSIVLSPNAISPASRQAQQSAISPAPPAAGDADAASPEMVSLIHAISGRWSAIFKFEPGPEMPNGAEAKGEEIWKPLAGGLVLSDEEAISLPGGQVHLLGLIWWDQVEKQFRGMQCISRSPHACDLKAALQDVAIKWDGKQLTVEEQQTSSNGKKALWHETFSEITSGSFIQVGESWDPGGLHRKVVTVHGSRISE